jgi:hypothetical protein
MGYSLHRRVLRMKFSILLIWMLTCVLFGPSIPQDAAMEQKSIDLSKKNCAIVAKIVST